MTKMPREKTRQRMSLLLRWQCQFYSFISFLAKRIKAAHDLGKRMREKILGRECARTVSMVIESESRWG
jgi:hypothetical protein